MEEIELLENPEKGTAGISTALQLVESTGSASIQFGTLPGPIVMIPQEERPEESKREETFTDTLHRIIRRHKEALDKLHEM